MLGDRRQRISTTFETRPHICINMQLSYCAEMIDRYYSKYSSLLNAEMHSGRKYTANDENYLNGSLIYTPTPELP